MNPQSINTVPMDELNNTANRVRAASLVHETVTKLKSLVKSLWSLHRLNDALPISTKKIGTSDLSEVFFSSAESQSQLFCFKN